MRPDEVPDWLREQKRTARLAARAQHDPRATAALRGKAKAYAEAENALRQAMARDDPPRGSCSRPPSGWWCSLTEGHSGPCPTREDRP